MARTSSERAGVVWFTGIPASGKTTLATLVADRMRANGLRAAVLDGDALRRTASPGLGFTREAREESVLRAAGAAAAAASRGAWAVVALVSPYRDARAKARAVCAGAGLRFFEVHVRCPVRVAEERDPKGLYKRARSGEIPAFTGVSDPYEDPEAPDVVVDTDLSAPAECAERVLDALWG